MVNRTWSQWLVCVGIIVLAGCAGKGERIDILIPGGTTSGKIASLPGSGPKIAILPLDDQRPTQAHLGTRSHLWGGESYFDLPNGTVADAGTQALVDYLIRQGWNVSLARTTGNDDADITITGSILSLSIDAKSGVMHTNLDAKNTLSFKITNRSDNSVVREHVSGTATDRVFWFDREDAQHLITGLFETNFNKLLGDLKVEGRTIRLK